MSRMDTRAFRSTLSNHGLAPEVSDAIVDLVEESREPFVTNEKLELEMTKLRSELRGEMSELRGELREEMSELRSELREEMNTLGSGLRGEVSDSSGGLQLQFAQLRTEFAEHKLQMTRLTLGTSGALGFLMIMLRFLPA